MLYLRFIMNLWYKLMQIASVQKIREKRMLKVGVFGATGKVGREVVGIIADSADLSLTLATTSSSNDAVGRFVKTDHPKLGEVVKYTDQPDAQDLDDTEVLVDFSLFHGVKDNIALAVSARCPYVVGVSALDDTAKAALQEAAKTIPIVYAHSTSLGVTVMQELVNQAAKLLDKSFDIEIHETHHRGKIDAPSGVAKVLAQVAAVARGEDPGAVVLSGRDENAPERKSGQIGVSSARGGLFNCHHQVSFHGDDETITISHTGQSRALFARGAIAAARWVVNRPAGLYTMADVLGVDQV